MTVRFRALSLCTLLGLSACGGGGGDSGPTVTSAALGTPRYGQSVLVTVNGSGLAGGLSLSSAGCANISRSTTAPNVSSDTTAYYTCTVSAMGAQTIAISRTDAAAPLNTLSFTVPAPQVTMTVGNGAGVGGSLVITLAPDRTPITVDNFLAYVNAGFYDGTVFHRVVPGFVVQGGGFLPVTGTPTLKAGLREAIALEANKGLSNSQWSIAMARTPAVNSATSQFFINLVNNTNLDPSAVSAGYAVFGSVTDNTALVSAIVAAPCTPVAGFSECLPAPAMVISLARQTR
jgi:cyclophilin family peptidyl-prolyl cis-trans isomerase